MKIMKLMQVRYVYLRKVEIELRQLEETDRPPERPSKFSIYDNDLKPKKYNIWWMDEWFSFSVHILFLLAYFDYILQVVGKWARAL